MLDDDTMTAVLGKTSSIRNMPNIHPTSIVEDGAQIADDAEIGPFCCISGKAAIGSGTKLVSHVSVQNRTTIGENNIIYPNAVLGAAPQDLKYKGEDFRADYW